MSSANTADGARITPPSRLAILAYLEQFMNDLLENARKNDHLRDLLEGENPVEECSMERGALHGFRYSLASASSARSA